MLTVLDTEATDMDTHTLTTERDPLMLSQRPRLMLLSSTEPTDTPDSDTDTVLTHMPMEDMDTHMPMVLTTERDPLMPSQRLMPMLTTDTTDMPDLMLTVLDTEATDTDTHMLTTERDLLMLSQRPRLMPLSSTEPMDMLVSHTLDTLPMVLTHMPTELTHMLMELTTERDPLMPSQRPMPTTDTTDMPDLTPTDMPHMLMELTHTVMDMPGESKLFQPKVLSYCKPKAQ